MRKDGREKLKVAYKPSSASSIGVSFPSKTQIKPLFVSSYLNKVKQERSKKGNGVRKELKPISHSLNLDFCPVNKYYLVVFERLNSQRLSTSMKVREWHLLKILHSDLLDIIDFFQSYSLTWVKVNEDVKLAVENHEHQKQEGLERKRTVRVPLEGIGVVE